MMKSLWQLRYAIFLCGTCMFANARPKVAFTATLTRVTHLAYHQAVKYDRVLSNIGRAYHPWTGHFTVPMDGVYLISCTAMSETNMAAYVQIIKNRQVMSTLHSSAGTYPQSSQTLVLRLRKNDRVWVRGMFHNQILNDNSSYNVFTGVLLN
ncbi:complement C1q subcomponent subunit B-like [Saccostrea cucullata]|uniref:complement C1q subcomponent subunit B-like n=1 Tax=Saccostrea cuccullata TaxID=36930 RepID=UPI002ED58973